MARSRCTRVPVGVLLLVLTSGLLAPLARQGGEAVRENSPGGIPRSAGAPWANVSLVSDGYAGTYWNQWNSHDVEIEFDSAGTAHAVWANDGSTQWGAYTNVFYTQWTAATGWSNVTCLSDYHGWNTDHSRHPDLAVGPDDSLHVVWSDQTTGAWGGGSSDSEIWYMRWTPTTGWTFPELVSDGFEGVFWNDGKSERPSIAVDCEGSVHVAWDDEAGGPWNGFTTESEIWFARREQGAWTNASLVSDAFQAYWNDDDSSAPALFVDPDGRVNVAWEDDTDGAWGTDTEVMYAWWTPGTGWSYPVVISDGFGGTYWNDADSDEVSLAGTCNGMLCAVWEDTSPGPWGPGGSDEEILSAVYTPGSGWANVTCVSDGFAGSYWNHDKSRRPEVAIDDAGVAHVVWYDYASAPWGPDTSNSEILHASAPVGGAWSNVTCVGDGYGGVYWHDDSAWGPTVAVGPEMLLVAWLETDDGAWGTESEIMSTHANNTGAGKIDCCTSPPATPPVNVAPAISAVDAVEAWDNETGRVISWTVTDAGVQTPTYTITRNGTLIATDGWSSGVPLTAPLAGLAPGGYAFTLTAYDGLGLSAMKTILVTIHAATPGGTPSGTTTGTTAGTATGTTNGTAGGTTNATSGNLTALYEELRSTILLAGLIVGGSIVLLAIVLAARRPKVRLGPSQPTPAPKGATKGSTKGTTEGAGSKERREKTARKKQPKKKAKRHAKKSKKR